MGARVGLTDQIAAVDAAVASIEAVLRERDFYRLYPRMVDFEIDNLRAVARTLAWFQAHEQTIRGAVRLAVDTNHEA